MAASFLPNGLVWALAVLQAIPTLAAAAMHRQTAVPVPEGQYPLHLTLPDASWLPRETGSRSELDPLGLTPRPTPAPLHPRFGATDLFRRQDDTTLKTNECGFLPNGGAFYCQGDGAQCKHDGTHLGCCAKDGTCKFRAKTCINYKESTEGACQGVTDPATRCCSESNNGFCFTMQFSTTTEPGKILTLLDCQANGGTGILYNSPQVKQTTATTTSSTKTTSTQKSTTTTTTAPTTGTSTVPAASASTAGSQGGEEQSQQQDSSSSSSSSSNTGAIAGGVVGGVAFLGLIGAAVFLLLRRRRAKPAASVSDGQTATPGATYPPTSPYPTHLSAAYPTASPGSAFSEQRQKDTWHNGQQPYPPSQVSSVYGSPQPAEMMQQGYHSYQSPTAPAELDQTHVIHEMPGESVARR